MRPLFVFAHLNCCNIWVRLISRWFHTLFTGSPANLMSIALLWNRGLRPLSIIACLVLGQKGKSSFSARTGNSDWTGSWGDFWSMWHFVLPFDEYFIQFWYPPFQRFRRSSDNCGKTHVRIILGHPIYDIFAFSNIFKTKWPKSEETQNCGCRWAWVPMNAYESVPLPKQNFVATPLAVVAEVTRLYFRSVNYQWAISIYIACW